MAAESNRTHAGWIVLDSDGKPGLYILQTIEEANGRRAQWDRDYPELGPHVVAVVTFEKLAAGVWEAYDSGGGMWWTRNNETSLRRGPWTEAQAKAVAATLNAQAQS